MKKTLLLIMLLCVARLGMAQDIHFSQFSNAPLSLNPALAGAFNADHRVIINYKSQWHDVSKSFLTYGLSYDAGILKGKLNGGILGIGIQVFNDQAGVNKMGQTEANVSLAYHLPLNRNNFLTAGIQGGFAQRRLSGGSAQWDSQYDPNATDGYNSSLPSGEAGGFSSKIYGDIAAGMLWSYNSQQSYITANNMKKVSVGVALFHINRPKQSFEGGADRLNMKIALSVTSFVGFKNSHFAILPSGVWFNQGSANDILFGTMLRYRLNDASKYTGFVSETALAIGCHYRVGDAIIPSAEFEWKNFMLQLSYDINVSQLTSATKGAGGIEVAVRYIAPLFDSKNKSLY